MKVKKGYTYDDVLLVPQYSDIKSRSEVDISTKLGKIELKIPLVSANMKSVTGEEMARAISSLGGLALLHRFEHTAAVYGYGGGGPHEWQRAVFQKLYHENHDNQKYIGVSIGLDDIAEVKKYFNIGVKIICIDVAHGHHKRSAGLLIDMAKEKPIDATIIAGNVATPRGAEFLRNAGADVIKVGIGPGSLCSTRIETGNGVPQLSALSEIAEIVGSDVIADGGIKTAGDIVKALCFSEAVMLGNLLAGTNESPGETIALDGNTYKSYAGSSTHKSNHVEGIIGLVPTKGTVLNIISKLLDGIKSGLSYQGAVNIKALQKHPEFVEISAAGLSESHPHSIRLK